MLIPRDYQSQAVDSVWAFLMERTAGHPVVAMPTGTGKALVIALLVERLLTTFPHLRILNLTHVKELVDQNYLEFLGLWPSAPAGVYSAGLKRKDIHASITFAGIASIHKNVEAFRKINLILIDECHLLSTKEESMYQTVIAKLMKVNPHLRVIGFTATPWRAGQGHICEDGIFTDVCFDVTNLHSFNRFIKEGYLVPLIPLRTRVQQDVSQVKIRGGEFDEKELQEATSKDEITYAALQEAVAAGRDRKHWLVFGAGIDNVLKITEMLQYLGISARCVHSKMSDKERDQNIADWKAGKFVAMVNNGILTTGVNFKAIDMIIMLRPTMSTVLWVQMLGRGTRPDYAPGFDLTTPSGRLGAILASGKQNCMVLDFAGNTSRLGPINDPVLPRKKGSKTGEVPIRICDNCGMYNHISARFCGGVSKHDPEYSSHMGCGEQFVFQNKLETVASNKELIREVQPPLVVDYKVDTVTFKLHKKSGKPDMLKVTYFCGVSSFTEFILIGHEGWGRNKAKKWWGQRTNLAFPNNAEEAMMVHDRLDVPTHIRVWVNKEPFPEVLAATFIGAFQVPINGDEIPF